MAVVRCVVVSESKDRLVEVECVVLMLTVIVDVDVKVGSYKSRSTTD